MNKRLIWNFEIDPGKPLTIPENLPHETQTARWESRFFWGEQDIIVLHGLDDRFLDLSRYEVKHRQDTYCLLTNTDYNIKIRRNQPLYKPVIQRTLHAVAYGKKINLEEQGDEGRALLEQIQHHGQHIDVAKEALIFRFDTKPTLKLELARLKISDSIYFSASIESRSKLLVETITQQIIARQTPCDYVTFLKSR